ncbi:hypothetical protein UXN85_20655 [Enterobacter hormaechei]
MGAYVKQKAKLTKKELAWIDELQEVIDRCPSPGKIGFYTIGDPKIHLYDLRKEDQISALDDDLVHVIQNNGWAFEEADIDFPSAVNGVCG